MWRNLHDTGVQMEDGKMVTLSLEQAADVVGVSKKSLDDYYSQLRKARVFGFNFSEHKQSMFGIVRKFVKSEEDKQKAEAKAAAKSSKTTSKRGKKKDK